MRPGERVDDQLARLEELVAILIEAKARNERAVPVAPTVLILGP